MSTAAKVAQHKAAHPELYCPKCLWRTGGGYCPRHKTNETPAQVAEAVAGMARHANTPAAQAWLVQCEAA